MTRTTLRLPTAVHRQLRQVAIAEGTTSERILLDALQRELARRQAKQRDIVIPDRMTPLLAELFLQSLPTFALIKDRRACIRWVNSHFETTFGKPLHSIAGRPITEIEVLKGIRRDTIEAAIAKALATNVPVMSTESLTLQGVGAVIVRTHRFTFADSLFLGDVSFLERDLEEGHFEVAHDVIQRMQNSKLEPGVEELLVPFLNEAPASMALKRPDGDSSVILWANKVYCKLAKAESLNQIVGRTTQDVFKLKATHETLLNEADVAATGRACMAKETLPELPTRWSLRFPIFGCDGDVALIGVVSPEFQQGAATSTASQLGTSNSV